jgi:hypothetical protein
MKKTILFLAFLLPTLPLLSQSTYDNVRHGRKVKDQIFLNLKADGSIDFRIDGLRKAPKTLESVNYFQCTDSEFRVYVSFVNPLRYRISSSEKALDDELYQAGSAFAAGNSMYFYSTQGGEAAVNPVGGRLRTSSAAAPGTVTNDFETTDPKIAELFVLIKSFDNTFFDRSRVIQNPNKQVFEKLKIINIENTQTLANSKLNMAYKALLNITQAGNINDAINANKTNLDSAKTAISNLIKDIEGLSTAIAGVTAATDKIDKNELLLLSLKVESLKKAAESIQSTFNDQMAKYEKIRDLFTDTRIEIAENRIAVKSAKDIKSGKRFEVTINVEKLVFNEKDGSITTSESKEYIIHLRRHQWFIPTVSSGLFYSSLTFDQYGTGVNTAGETIVTEAKVTANPLTLAGHLNFNFNTTQDLNWFIQVGIGPTKEKPVLMLGLGGMYRNVQISTGYMWTWQPKLQKLQLNQVVSGTAEIDSDLKFEFDKKGHWYIGFGIPLTK